jgi:hypothetical protein
MVQLAHLASAQAVAVELTTELPGKELQDLGLEHLALMALERQMLLIILAVAVAVARTTGGHPLAVLASALLSIGRKTWQSL